MGQLLFTKLAKLDQNGSQMNMSHEIHQKHNIEYQGDEE
jgi:hypothetical protein